MRATTVMMMPKAKAVLLPGEELSSLQPNEDEDDDTMAWRHSEAAVPGTTGIEEHVSQEWVLLSRKVLNRCGSSAYRRLLRANCSGYIRVRN